jgi:hypothetical protein
MKAWKRWWCKINQKGYDFQGELQALNLPFSHIEVISHIY